MLYDLERKTNLKSDEERNRDKIIDVYQNYSFDVGASRLLINSDVLLLIKESFEPIVYEENTRKRRKLRDFLSEYHRLRNQWEIAESNSPLNGVSLKDLPDRNAEMIVVVESFDQTHQQVIIEKHSYGANDWIENVKFKRNFNTNKNGEIVLRVDELDDLIPIS